MEYKTRADVEEDYTVDEYGIIRSRGKFEAEMWYAPIIYGWVMEGGNERIGSSDFIRVTPEIRDDFELEADVDWLGMHESDNGFVYIGTATEAQFKAFQRNARLYWAGQQEDTEED